MPAWPELTVARDHETFAMLHLVSQMLGKLRVAHAPWSNHGWHVALHPTAAGLITAPMAAGDGRSFTLAIDLCRDAVTLRVSDGALDEISLVGTTIADLHAGLVAMLDWHKLPSTFSPIPSEIADPVRFVDDIAPRAYDPDSALRLREALALVVPICEQFRAGFIGKCSPVHLFWGAFDLAVTRFSGRVAPPHPGGIPGLPDRITREAYSHEVSSAGFWPGGVTEAEPMFYSYAYPEPPGFRAADPEVGRFDEGFGEFVLPYAEVRASPDPEAMLTTFLHNTYAAAAELAHWDRAALEREPVAP